MKHIVEIDSSDWPSGDHRKVLAGPQTGIESCILSYARVSPSAPGEDLHTCQVDHFYYVIDGSLKFQLGTEQFAAGPDTLVFVPGGTPHRHWNDGSTDAFLFETVVPAPSPADGVQRAEPRPVPNAGTLVRRPHAGGAGAITPSEGFRLQSLAERSSGSEHVSIAAVDLQPALGGARLHFHDFDQFYFVLEGTLDLQIGTRKMAAGANSLVVIPAGTLHANFNAGPGIERHVTLRVPEPADGEPLERLVIILPENEAAG